MKVSLNKANKLRNSLDNIAVDTHLTIAIRTDVKDANAEVGVASNLFKEALEKSVKVLEVEHNLRSLISTANHEHGVQELIGSIAAKEKLLKLKTKLLGSMEFSAQRYPKVEDFIAKQEAQARLVAVNPEKIATPVRENVSIVCADMQNELVSEIKTLKLEISKLQEDRNEKNHQVYMILPDDMVSFLKENQLV